MRVIVTGGAGFIGSAVVRRLVATGHDVLNVDLLTYAGTLSRLEGLDGSHHRFEKADVRDGQSLLRAMLAFRPDAVIHLAAETHVDRSIDRPADFVLTNVVGTQQLLSACLEFCGRQDRLDRFLFVHVSTDEVFGALGNTGRFDRMSPYAPRSPYAATKAAADHLVRSYHQTFGLSTVVTNCSNNYGPYQYPEKLIPHMIVRALDGRGLPVYGDGSNVRDWIHVDDHARGLVAVLERGQPGRSYLFGGSAERTNLEVVSRIAAILDDIRPRRRGRYQELIEFVPDRPGHDFRYAIDSSQTESELAWRPERDFSTGLRQTVAWYVEHEAWWRDLMSAGYVPERIGTGDRT